MFPEASNCTVTGCVITLGFSVSVTTTSNEQVLMFPEGSVAVNVFVVVPTGNTEPLARPVVCAIVGDVLPIKETLSTPNCAGPVDSSGIF